MIADYKVIDYGITIVPIFPSLPSSVQYPYYLQAISPILHVHGLCDKFIGHSKS